MTYWRWGCKFIALELLDQVTKHYGERLKEHWKAFATLPLNCKVVVSNHRAAAWADGHENRSRMKNMSMSYKLVKAAGHEIMFVGEPPGVESAADHKYFACTDVPILLLSRLWTNIHREE